MELTDELKTTYIAAAQALKGSHRRIFMAQIVKSLGRGGQRRAERELGWARTTIRKGLREWTSGQPQIDNFSARGRKKITEKHPQLLGDIRAIVDGQSQTDATFDSTRLYTRLSVAEIRRQLIVQKGYTDAQLPRRDTLRMLVNSLGYRLRSVQKSRPQKK
jgi:hypothetical protein